MQGDSQSGFPRPNEKLGDERFVLEARKVNERASFIEIDAEIETDFGVRDNRHCVNSPV